MVIFISPRSAATWRDSLLMDQIFDRFVATVDPGTHPDRSGSYSAVCTTDQPRSPHPSGTRKREVHRRRPKDKSTNSLILGVETASCLRETHQQRWGAKTPSFLMGFPEAGGGFDPKIRRNLALSFGSLRRSSLLRVPEPSPQFARPPRLDRVFSRWGFNMV